jgi:hypothetical protein
MRFLSLMVALSFIATLDAIAQQSLPTTAWEAGHFVVDTAGLLSRSDIVLGQPNLLPAEAMPMGNGRLGIAIWSADGFTAQLNREDTLPHRDSPGQVIIPGLAALTSAKDFAARLDLYNGTLVEHGGGMTLTAYVQVSTDTLVIDVAGANPNTTQIAELRLWPPRTPQATAAGKSGSLAQTWVDQYGPGASGETFGALAAITATGRDVSAAVSGPRAVTVTFKPAPDGHFRVIVACPSITDQRQKRSASGTPWRTPIPRNMLPGGTHSGSAPGSSSSPPRMVPGSTWRTCAISISTVPRLRAVRAFPARRPASPTFSPPCRMSTTGTQPLSGTGIFVCRSPQTSMPVCLN